MVDEACANVYGYEGALREEVSLVIGVPCQWHYKSNVKQRSNDVKNEALRE